MMKLTMHEDLFDFVVLVCVCFIQYLVFQLCEGELLGQLRDHVFCDGLPVRIGALHDAVSADLLVEERGQGLEL